MFKIFSLKTSSCGCGGSVPVVRKKQRLTVKNGSKKSSSKKIVVGKSVKKIPSKARSLKKK